jgi:hypothetical protein
VYVLAVLQDGVVPMDDDDDEDEEEEEEEYLDDEASDDQWADGTGMQPFEWETAAPPVQTAWRTMPPLQDGLLFDDLLPMPGMRVDFGRAGGRRMQGMRMGGAPAAAAGVWDDAGDGMEGGLPDPMMAGRWHMPNLQRLVLHEVDCWFAGRLWVLQNWQWVCVMRYHLAWTACFGCLHRASKQVHGGNACS